MSLMTTIYIIILKVLKKRNALTLRALRHLGDSIDSRAAGFLLRALENWRYYHLREDIFRALEGHATNARVVLALIARGALEERSLEIDSSRSKRIPERRIALIRKTMDRISRLEGTEKNQLVQTLLDNVQESDIYQLRWFRYALDLLKWKPGNDAERKIISNAEVSAKARQRRVKEQRRHEREQKFDALVEQLRSEDVVTSYKALKELEKIARENEKLAPVIVKAFGGVLLKASGSTLYTNDNAVRTLGDMGEKAAAAVPDLLKALQVTLNYTVKYTSSPGTVAAAVKAFEEKLSRFKQEVQVALSKIGTTEALEALEEVKGHS